MGDAAKQATRVLDMLGQISSLADAAASLGAGRSGGGFRPTGWLRGNEAVTVAGEAVYRRYWPVLCHLAGRDAEAWLAWGGCNVLHAASRRSARGLLLTQWGQYAALREAFVGARLAVMAAAVPKLLDVKSLAKCWVPSVIVAEEVHRTHVTRALRRLEDKVGQVMGSLMRAVRYLEETEQTLDEQERLFDLQHPEAFDGN